MRKVFKIAYWEFVEKVKRKSFIIYIILFPLLLMALGLIPSMLGDLKSDETVVIGIWDKSGVLYPDLNKELRSYQLPNGAPKFLTMNIAKQKRKSDSKNFQADSLVTNGILRGYLLIESNDGSFNFSFRTRGINYKSFGKLKSAVSSAVAKHNLLNAGINRGVIDQSFQNIQFEQEILKKNGEASKDILTIFFSAYLFIMLLLMMIIFSGGLLVRSIVEEKSNRIIEILISSCTPKQLLAGKIIGLSFLGLFQFAVWFTMGFLLISSSAVSFEMFHNLGLQILYFILGYILYTGLFVGIGSIVTTEHEAQQFTGYISILLVIPIIISVQIIQSPHSLLADILTYFPLTSPPIMILKLNFSDPSTLEIISTILIVLASMYLIIFLTARIFRIGILSYGKTPGIKELRNWLNS